MNMKNESEIRKMAQSHQGHTRAKRWCSGSHCPFSERGTDYNYRYCLNVENSGEIPALPLTIKVFFYCCLDG